MPHFVYILESESTGRSWLDSNDARLIPDHREERFFIVSER